MSDTPAVQDDSTGNLVPVFTAEIGGQSMQAVDARSLHGFLGVNRDFTTWIKKRISDYGFVEHQDYLLTKTGEQMPSGTKYLSDYHLTLDMAKEISMLEKNETGRQVRRYFIECERIASQVNTSVIEIKNIENINTLLPRQFSIRTLDEFHALTNARILFWTLEKRDQIVHPSIDRGALFSVTQDVQRSIKSELIQELLGRFSGHSNPNDPEILSFIKNWRPSFASENNL